MYILYCTVSKLLQIIGQICTSTGGVPVFNTLVRGEPLNSEPRSLALKKLDECLYCMVWYGMVYVNLYSAIVANVSNARMVFTY